MCIRGSIIKGMKQACDDSLDFHGEIGIKLNTEYLLTVNVAREIRNANLRKADPHEIRIEQSSEQFSRDCLPPYLRGKITGIERPGRIDVAVYAGESLGKRHRFPICPIEIKGFDPGKSLVLSDLKRNRSFFYLTGKSGKSELELAYFCSLHSFQRTKFGDVPKNLQRLKQRLQGYIPQIGSLEGITVDIDAFDISHNSNGEVLDEGNYHTVNCAARHHFAGAIIEFRRN